MCEPLLLSATSGKLGKPQAGSRCGRLALFSHRPKQYMAPTRQCFQRGDLRCTGRKVSLPFSWLWLHKGTQINDSRTPEQKRGSGTREHARGAWLFIPGFSLPQASAPAPCLPRYCTSTLPKERCITMINDFQLV